MSVTCALCREAIEKREIRGMYSEVRGWDRKREQGGTNALRNREETGRVAHAHCVERLVAGRLGQEALL